MESAKGGKYLARVEVENDMLWQEVSGRCRDAAAWGR